MRHGSVSYFEPGNRAANTRDVALNDMGRMQAQAAGDLFARIGIRFDRVIVSGLARTRETADAVLSGCEVVSAVEIWPEFEEMHLGSLASVPDDELREAVVGTFEGVVPEHKRFAGGESIGELLDRVHPALARLRTQHDWDTLLLVLHGGVNR